MKKITIIIGLIISLTACSIFESKKKKAIEALLELRALTTILSKILTEEKLHQKVIHHISVPYIENRFVINLETL